MRAAIACTAVGILASLVWALITPAFRFPDEIDHYAYVEQIAREGRPPSPGQDPARSDEVDAAARGLDLQVELGAEPSPAIWHEPGDDRLRRLLDRAGDANGNAVSFGATPQPPLYYALAAIPFRVADGTTLLWRLWLVRFASVLLAGVTVLFVFLFLRETLPRWPWAWSVGALGVALQPVFGFMSGAANPDALLYASSAALFYLLARGFRRGLSARLAIAIGLALAIGCLGKSNFLGLVPGALVALLAIALRRERTPSLSALRLPALALLVAAVPVAVVAVLNVGVWDRPAVGLVSDGIVPTQDGSLLGAADFTWQLFLPPLPGVERLFPEGVSTTRLLWLDGFVGRYGIEPGFGKPFSDVAIAVLASLAVLAAITLVRCRGAIRARRLEVATWTLMTLGVVALIGAQGYALQRAGLGGVGQTRYLFPLLPLYGLLLALAARGTGSRRAPALGALIVMLALGHAVFSQLVMVSRWYA